MSSGRARGVGDRVRNAAAAAGVDAQRLRRSVVFQRVLVRLASSTEWVLKGGFCMEVRLGAARSTRDLDLALSSVPASGADLQEQLDDLLRADPQGDGFTFRVRQPSPTADTGAGPGWRVVMEALIEGQAFETIKLDVVVRADEVTGGTERLDVPPPVPIAGFGPVEILAVDVAQHAAEKIHAYSRVYAGDRPSSRVKDLVDLVLFVEAGLVDPAAMGARLLHVYAVRDEAPPPGSLPRPPESWIEPYAAMVADLPVTAVGVDAAYELVQVLYAQATATLPTTATNEGTHP